ncbi:MAG: radical SAM family heme chaperone HemW [Oscillospiraceae bacterium]|nr:radical SAM family heme chaperone HemW [Oscillospiraceae bacterium]
MEAGLYIHIPFCKKKCNYCDFYSCGGCDGVPEEYVDAVVRELKLHKDLKYVTVYFGGGTPSLLTAKQVEKILSAADIKDGAEITLEANPDTLTQEKLNGYFAAGVNRLSIGVQTVYDKSLAVLGRIHNAEKAGLAFDMAKQAGFVNISGDLMLGLDNYSEKEMCDTIDFLADHGATHISAYMLKVEEGTPFYTNRPENLATEEELADYYLAACEYLKKKGYVQYEISNFCKEGYHSRHNSIYWKLGNYLGIGPSAHSCMEGKRFYYERDLESFIKGCSPVYDGEVDADDYIMLSLRLKEGMNLETLKNVWGLKISSHTAKKLEIYNKQGFITTENNCISLTPAGFLAENVIASDIMSGVENIKEK